MPAPTLVDTDILIDAAHGVSEAINCLDYIKSTSSLSISIVTQMELIVGCRNKTELRSLDKFLQQFRIIALDSSISQKAIDLLSEYCLSHGLLIADSLIAATAITQSWPFITKNQKHYKFINDLDLLRYPKQ